MSTTPNKTINKSPSGNDIAADIEIVNDEAAESKTEASPASAPDVPQPPKVGETIYVHAPQFGDNDGTAPAMIAISRTNAPQSDDYMVKDESGRTIQLPVRSKPPRPTSTASSMPTSPAQSSQSQGT